MNWNVLLFEKGLDVPLEEIQFNILCPFHEDSKPSMSINTVEGVWICHAGCGQGTLRQLYKKLYGEEVPLKYNFEENFSDEDIFNFETFEDDIIQPEITIPFKLDSVPSWIFDRGFTKEILKSWNCGISEEYSLVIPVTENRKTIGWVCRRRAYIEPKYVYSPGMRISRVVFGADRLKEGLDYICITEGTLDTIWMDQNGFPSIALLGLTLSKVQEYLISKLAPREYILCLDNDSPGKAATEKIAAKLEKYALVSQITLPKTVKDVQEIRDSMVLSDVVNSRTLIGGI